MNDRASADTAPAERLHPLILLTGLGGSLRGLAGGYAGVAYLAATGNLTIALLAAAALLLFVAISLFIYWRRFEFRVGADEIRIDSGMLNRVHRSIPFDRIQDVDISQGPAARLLGLAKVRFETGAGGGAEEGALAAVSLARAEELRALIRARRGAAQPVAEAKEEKPPLYALTPKRLLLEGLFNFSFALFAGLVGFTQTFGDALGFDPLSRRFWESILARAGPAADYVLAHRLVAAVAGTAMLILIGFLTGIVRTSLRDFGFRLDRTESGLRRRRGLLSRSDVTLPVARAQAMVVGTGPVRSAFGWRNLHLQNLARDEGGGDHVLAPLANDEEIAAIAGEIGWRPPVADGPWQRVSRADVTLYAIGLSPFILLPALLSAVGVGLAAYAGESIQTTILDSFFPTIVTMLAVIAACALLIGLRYLAWRRTGYRFEGDRLLVRRGWWKQRILALPRNRIQSVQLSENFLTRRFGVTRLTFGIAGGRDLSLHAIPTVPSETARTLRRDLLA